MAILKVCPQCSTPAIFVDHKTVMNMLVKKNNFDGKGDEVWHVCVNETCSVTYFNVNKIYGIDDLKVKLWFKDADKDVPICYCSNLTREEIKTAVQNGCKTIDDVQQYTDKNITGKCLTMNPL